MPDSAAVRHGRPPFFWALNAAMEAILRDLPERKRANAVSVLSLLAYAASRERDGGHDGFVPDIAVMYGTLGWSRATFYRTLADLETIRVLYRQERRDERGGQLPSLWILTDPRLTGETPPCLMRDTSDETANARPRETKKKQESLSLSANAPRERTRGRVKCQGKAVPAPLVEKAERIFDAYCSATGRKMRPYAGTGAPSKDLEKIIRWMVEYPDLDEAELAGKMRNYIAEPPSWIEGGVVTVGQMFGPNAFSHLMARSSNGNGNGNGKPNKITEALLAAVADD